MIYEQDIRVATDVSSRELEMISVHADTADHVGNMLRGFIDRHRGGLSGQASSTEKCPPNLSGYSASLERLGKNLQRLDELAREIGSIG